MFFTKEIWWDFEFKATHYRGENCVFPYEEEKLVWLLLATILGTPFAIILDIITLPMQIIYYVCLKTIRKIRSDIK